MKINILHLYPDLLNLYGESGNIKAIKNYLEYNNIKVNIKNCSIEDEINLKNIDLIYIGMGTEENQNICIKHINKYKTKIQNYIEDKGFVLSTGNSIELFGKYIKNKKTKIQNYIEDKGFVLSTGNSIELFGKYIKNKKTKTLGIFDYYTGSTNLVDQPLYKTDFIDEEIIGFINKRSEIKNVDNHYLFTNQRPNNEDKIHEGYHYKNFYGTYLLGPILVRNPKLLEYICKKILENKNINIELISNLDLEYSAYKEFLKNYYNIVVE